VLNKIITYKYILFVYGNSPLFCNFASNRFDLFIVRFGLKILLSIPLLSVFYMFKIRVYCCFAVLILLCSCNHPKGDSRIPERKKKAVNNQPIIVDCKYTFEEAIEGTRAPEKIISQLKLINVRYYSTDKKIHQGQVLTNREIADDIEFLFRYMYSEKFPIAKAIPIVKYNWDDEASMQDNNTSSFCYRDVSFSKHARGMAIDINPYFNPVRWKAGYENRLNKPVGAHFNPSIPGTFYRQNSVVQEFKKLGFHWGHDFKMKFDDHHFDK